MIYRSLVVSTSPITVDYNPATSIIYLRLKNSTENGIAVAFLTDTIRGSLLSMEIAEIFFKKNVFECEGSKVLKDLTQLRSLPVEGRSDMALLDTPVAREVAGGMVKEERGMEVLDAGDTNGLREESTCVVLDGDDEPVMEAASKEDENSRQVAENPFFKW